MSKRPVAICRNSKWKSSRQAKLHKLYLIDFLWLVLSYRVAFCIFFLIYLINFSKILNDIYFLFADDIFVLISCSKSRELEIKLNSTLNRIVSWQEIHNLQLNLNKTKIIQFQPFQRTALKISFNSKIQNIKPSTLLYC